jgi:hypothetical protein
MRLSDAGARRQTKLIYPNHRLPPCPTEGAAPRSLEPIVRPDLVLYKTVSHQNDKFTTEILRPSLGRQ